MGLAAVVPRYRQDLVTLSCGECGIEFAVPDWWSQERRNDKRSWYCPNGHVRAFIESESQKRIRELETAVEAEKRRTEIERSNREWAESQKRSANIRRGKAEAALKRAHKRAHAGVCPHCNRTFSQLARHMQSKHSEALEHS